MAFVGAHSTGKSTLLRHISATTGGSLRLVAIDGITRQLILQGFPMGKNTVVDSWTRYVDEQLRRERELVAEPYDLLISDRTVIDAAAYATVNRELPRPFIPQYFVSMLREVAFRTAAYYDLFAYFPIEFSMHPDGIRDDDEDYRHAIDRCVFDLLKEAGLDFVSLTGTVVQRFNTLMDRLPPALRETNNEDTGMISASAPAHDVARLRAGERASFENAVLAEGDLRAAGYDDVLDSALFGRLQGVSFLGVLDDVYNIAHPENRREHSVSVGHLALQLARHLHLEPVETEVLVLANLLHDVGHAPFSHNSEPFLLESRNVYHHGLLTSYLRYGANALDTQYSVKNLLKQRRQEVRTAVASLLMKKREGTGRLYDLFVSPLNCDKIDGNGRTLRLLNRQGIPPATIIECLERQGDGIFVRSDRLSLVMRFWELEAQMYWDSIYTQDVFAAEAMLTRALTFVFNSPELVSAFCLSADADVVTRMGTHALALSLMQRLRRRNLYAALSTMDHALYREAKERMAPLRFDRAARNGVEDELAAALHLPSGSVISHYSRRKHFTGDLAGIRQRTLFDDIPGLLPLSHVNAQLASSKVSGDFFEVFCDTALPQNH